MRAENIYRWSCIMKRAGDVHLSHDKQVSRGDRNDIRLAEEDEKLVKTEGSDVDREVKDHRNQTHDEITKEASACDSLPQLRLDHSRRTL